MPAAASSLLQGTRDWSTLIITTASLRPFGVARTMLRYPGSRLRHVALQAAYERAGLRVVCARACTLRGPQDGVRPPSVRHDSRGQLLDVVGADERRRHSSHFNADPSFVALPAGDRGAS